MPEKLLISAPDPLRVTDEMRATARSAPGGWIFAVDPHFEPAPGVPARGLVGAWRIDEAGEIGPEFRDNPVYMPSPAAHGWPPPDDDVDRAAQLVAARYATRDDVVMALVYDEVDYAVADRDLVLDEEGRVVVYSRTAPHPHVLPEGATWQRSTGRALAVRNAEQADLLVNPGPWQALVKGIELAARVGGEATGLLLGERVEDFLAGELDPRGLHEAFCSAQVFSQAGERPGFLAVQDGADRAVPVFTSLVELARFAGQTPWFAAPGQEILDLLPDGYDIVLDPGTPRAVRLRGDATARIEPPEPAPAG